MIKLPFMGIEAMKGKAYDKLPSFALNSFNDKIYHTSFKYDGNQIFIVNFKGEVSTFTSDWKPFDFPVTDMIYDWINHIKELPNFLMVAEFNYDCPGKLGDRGKSAVLTTYRTLKAKGFREYNPEFTNKAKIRVFDCVRLNQNGMPECSLFFSERKKWAASLELPSCFEIVDTKEMTGAEAMKRYKEVVAEGWEGLMLIEDRYPYMMGKRVNHVIKLKGRKTCDLLCIDTEPGDGKYKGMIGALVLKDNEGRVVRVGTGLDDSDRAKDPSYYIGKIIEITYEQIMDTYIQPSFITVRNDKEKSDD